MLIFIYLWYLFSSALSALHLYNEPEFMVIGNPVILEQSHAHNAPDLWDRGSIVLIVPLPQMFYSKLIVNICKLLHSPLRAGLQWDLG